MSIAFKDVFREIVKMLPDEDLNEVDRTLRETIFSRPANPAPTPETPPSAAVFRLPYDDEVSLTEVYGIPGDEKNLTWVDFPYQRVLYIDGGAPLTDHNNDGLCDHRAHKLIERRLEAAHLELLERFGIEQLREWGMHVFGGIFNHRPMKGNSNRLSTHSWGIAEDIDPTRNQYGKPEHRLPDVVFDTFERHGFLSLGRAIGHDWMHVQAAIPKTIKPNSYYGVNGLPKHIIPFHAP